MVTFLEYTHAYNYNSFFPLQRMKIQIHTYTCTGTYFSFDYGKRKFNAHEPSMRSSWSRKQCYKHNKHNPSKSKT